MPGLDFVTGGEKSLISGAALAAVTDADGIAWWSASIRGCARRSALAVPRWPGRGLAVGGVENRRYRQPPALYRANEARRWFQSGSRRCEACASLTGGRCQSRVRGPEYGAAYRGSAMSQRREFASADATGAARSRL